LFPSETIKDISHHGKSLGHLRKLQSAFLAKTPEKPGFSSETSEKLRKMLFERLRAALRRH